MIPFVIITLVLGLGLSSQAEFDLGLEDEWSKFKVTFERRYEESEEVLRKVIFMDNLKMILKHNMEADMGQHTYWMGINHFTDMSWQEFRNMMSGCVIKPNSTRGGATFLPPENVELPSMVDWRTKGYVTPVKDQGRCGSCWAFSTTGALEGQTKRKTGRLPDLSEQQLVDCSAKWGNAGCNGGLMDNAFKYVRDNGGLDSEACYPYSAKQRTCKFRPSCVAAKCNHWADIPRGNEKALQAAVASVGPVSVAIDASLKTFMHYSRGVYSDPQCSRTRLDHGVLVVGYGKDSGYSYWLVKNSWSAKWGLGGYIKMARNRNDMCGIASSASYPIV